jgi:hypothetical protein
MNHLAWVQVVSAMASLPFLWQAMRNLKLARILEDTPTSSIAHAQQGLVEVKGKTFSKAKNTLYVPMLEVPCVWYRFQAFYEHEHAGESDITFQESRQRIYLKDSTGECAIDPWQAEIMPKRTKRRIETGVTYQFSWIGVEEYLYVIGWLDTLHPMPQTKDELVRNKLSENPHLPRRYGQLTEPENLLKKPPHKELPFFIGANIEKRLSRRFRRLAIDWFLSFCAIGFGVPVLVILLG